jgi:hypothetical protein
MTCGELAGLFSNTQQFNLFHTNHNGATAFADSSLPKCDVKPPLGPCRIQLGTTLDAMRLKDVCLFNCPADLTSTPPSPSQSVQAPTPFDPFTDLHLEWLLYAFMSAKRWHTTENLLCYLFWLLKWQFKGLASSLASLQLHTPASLAGLSLASLVCSPHVCHVAG